MAQHPLDALPVPSEPPEERRPPVDDRGHLRFFSFWVANGTAIINLDGGQAPYDELIGPPGPALGELFEQHLAEGEVPGADAARWLRDWAVSGEKPPGVRLPAEAPPWKQVVLEFARDLGERRLAPDLLGEVDEESWECLLVEHGGSPLERVFMVLVNCLELDEQGQVLNADWARRRACWQLAMWHRDDVHDAVPPQEEWEAWLWS